MVQILWEKQPVITKSKKLDKNSCRRRRRRSKLEV